MMLDRGAGNRTHFDGRLAAAGVQCTPHFVSGLAMAGCASCGSSVTVGNGASWIGAPHVARRRNCN